MCPCIHKSVGPFVCPSIMLFWGWGKVERNSYFWAVPCPATLKHPPTHMTAYANQLNYRSGPSAHSCSFIVFFLFVRSDEAERKFTRLPILVVCTIFLIKMRQSKILVHSFTKQHKSVNCKSINDWYLLPLALSGLPFARVVIFRAFGSTLAWWRSKLFVH